MKDLLLLPARDGEDELERVVRSQKLQNGIRYLSMLGDDLARKDPTLNFFINIERDGFGHKTVTEMLDYLQENTRPGLCEFSRRIKPVNPESSIVEELQEHVSLLTATIKQCLEICSKHPDGTDYEVIRLFIEVVMKDIGRSIKPKSRKKGNSNKKKPCKKHPKRLGKFLVVLYYISIVIY